MLSRASDDVHCGAAAQVEPRRCTRSVRRNLEMLAAAKQRTHIAWRRIGICGHHLATLVRPDTNLQGSEPFSGDDPVEGFSIDVRHEVAKPVDSQYLAGDLFVRHLGQWNVEALHCTSGTTERR